MSSATSLTTRPNVSQVDLSLVVFRLFFAWMSNSDDVLHSNTSGDIVLCISYFWKGEKEKTRSSQWWRKEIIRCVSTPIERLSRQRTRRRARNRSCCRYQANSVPSIGSLRMDLMSQSCSSICTHLSFIYRCRSKRPALDFPLLYRSVIWEQQRILRQSPAIDI